MDRQAIVLTAEQDSASLVRGVLEPLGFKVTSKQKMTTALRAMSGEDLVVLDVPDTARSLKEIKSYHPEAIVIVLSDRSCQGKVVDEEAYFCIEKPVDEAVLRNSARNASRHLSLRENLDRLKQDERSGSGDPLTEVIVTPKVQRLMLRASKRDVPVLVSGEQGTGREFVARTIHTWSYRRHGMFKSISAADKQLNESVLHKTLGDMDGGTLYIRDLESVSGGMKQPLKDCLDRTLPGNGLSDIRVVCGANGSFDKTPLIKHFGLVVKIPSLDSRCPDIVPLAETFIGEVVEDFSLGRIRLSKQAGEALKAHHWPGNIRELKNTVTRACISLGEGTLEPKHLFPGEDAIGMSMKEFLEAKLGRYFKDMAKLGNASLHETVVSEVEKSLIELVLRETGGNQLRSAQALGITRTTLRSKIKNYRIKLK